MTPRTQTAVESTSTTSLRAADVAVLMGGRSGEREISLLSGAAVAAALRDSADGRGPARVHDVEIGADGTWRIGGRTVAPEEALLQVPRTTVWFLALHGGAGEDGTIQGFLEAAGRVHTGSGVGASALCMSKSWTRDVLRAAGITVAAGLSVDAPDWSASREQILARAAALGRSGLAVKPDRGGSSVATSLLRADGGVVNATELGAAIDRALATDDRVVVEARIVGVETTCGVLGNPRTGLRALTPVEIVPNAGRFFDYDEKYSASGAVEHCPPVSIGPDTCASIQAAAVRACAAAGCEGYARVDFMIPQSMSKEGPGGSEREPVCLEINTLPGMTGRSLLPLAAAEAGMGYRDLCLEILRLALERSAP